MNISERILLALSALNGRPRYDLGQKAVTRHILGQFAKGIVIHDRILQPSEYSDWRVGIIANNCQYAIARIKAELLKP